jgi:HSP20 family molecular chaperone IbpA
MGWPFQAHAPKVDVIDRGRELLVRAEIPGVTRDELQLSLTDRTVTIRGETHKESKEEKGDYFRREIASGSFQRTLALPCDVAGDHAKATFKDGVLELVLPKVGKSELAQDPDRLNRCSPVSCGTCAGGSARRRCLLLIFTEVDTHGCGETEMQDRPDGPGPDRAADLPPGGGGG